MENSKKKDGIVSLSLMSIEAQVKTLFAEAGGTPAVELLDRLCRLSDKEQLKVLGIFSRILDRVISGDVKLEQAGEAQYDTAQDDTAQKAFEDSLYNEIIAEISGTGKGGRSLRLEVLKGGQAVPIQQRQVVSIEDLRRAKKGGREPVV